MALLLYCAAIRAEAYLYIYHTVYLCVYISNYILILLIFYTKHSYSVYEEKDMYVYEYT